MKIIALCDKCGNAISDYPYFTLTRRDGTYSTKTYHLCKKCSPIKESKQEDKGNEKS